MGIFDIFSSKPGKNAAAQKAAGYKAGAAKAGTDIDTGVSQASGYYDEAYAPFSDLYDKNMAGFDAYGDATGINGPGGTARALETFKATPGYQVGLDSAVDQSDRRMAQRGMLASGNTITAGNEAAIDYTNKGYGDFVNRLAPFLGGTQAAATGGAAVKTGQGNLYDAAGKAKANFDYLGETGAGNANAEGELAAYNASGNFWNALMQGGNLAAKAYGMRK